MTIGDIADPDKVRAAKKALRIAVYYGRLTSLHVQLGVPYFYWFAKTSPDGGLPTPAFFANQLPDVKEAKDHVYSRIAPTLISLAMLHKARNDQKNLDAVVQLLGMCPPLRPYRAWCASICLQSMRNSCREGEVPLKA